MKAMIIGSGGREHALAAVMARSLQVEEVVAVPGNPGIAREPKCRCVDLADYEAMAEYALAQGIDLTVVGPEVPLVDGICDLFRARGLTVFGPGREEAQLEGSKKFSKEFMRQYGIATAGFASFEELQAAEEHIRGCAGPLVVKASGLCAGKGVTLCQDEAEARATLKSFMTDRIFQEAGCTVVIEDLLQGPEVSVLAIYDGNAIYPLVSAMDHKRIGEGDTGPNTGGMGTIAPAPYYTAEAEADFQKNILEPTLRGLKDRGFRDPACIFFGLMLTEDGAKLLEYNMRFGDPETQSVLALMESDLFLALLKACQGTLTQEDLKFSDETAMCLIGAAPGYPGSYEKNIPLQFPADQRVKVYFAGVREEDGQFLSTGGRIFGATAKGERRETRKILHAYMENFRESGILWRRDIGEERR